MNTIHDTPPQRELDRGTGMALTILGGCMILLCYLADGNVKTFPALLGAGFLVAGTFILLGSLRRRRGSRRKDS